MLENLAEYFYDPLIFWLMPVLLLLCTMLWRKLKSGWHRRHDEKPPGQGRAD